MVPHHIGLAHGCARSGQAQFIRFNSTSGTTQERYLMNHLREERGKNLEVGKNGFDRRIISEGQLDVYRAAER